MRSAETYLRQMESARARPAVVAPEQADPDETTQRIAALTEAVAARDTFIAVAAHELRNPMTPLVGQVELLLHAIRQDRCSLAQVETRLERIQQTVHRYVKRAEILLDVSRLTRGRLELELEPVEFAALVRSVAQEFAEPAQRIGIAIAIETPEHLHGTADRLALEQIVENLVSNAVKYGGCTPVEVGLAQHGENVRIEVRDHGDGIPPDARARVFEQFERAVGRGERRTGFGVGLWVVRQLVEAMGGMVAIEDAPGGGALFSVVLPRHVQAGPA